MDKNEAIKQAAMQLRSLSEENINLSAQNDKLESEKSASDKELQVYKTVCKLASDGDLDGIEISEKVASLLDKTEDEISDDLRRINMMKSGFGQIKVASASADGETIGESNPLTEYLTALN